MNDAPAPPPAGARSARLAELDVVRAVALMGVVVLNYEGYLLIRGGRQGTDLVDRVLDPWRGPLATRFAATFVLVAGMGVTLLTNRARLSGDRAAVDDARWRLVRRGLTLYAGGYVVDWIWNGTILFFYGAFFVVAALLFTLRLRWLVAIGVAAAVAAAALQWWRFEREQDGHRTDWLFGSSPRSPRALLFDTLVNGTHPLLPWLAFLVAGIVLGRLLPLAADLRVRLTVGGALVVAATYLVRDTADTPLRRLMLSTHPESRSLVYVASALGSSVVAFCMVGWLAERTRATAPTRMLAVAGRTTLSIYLLHVLVFDLLVDWWGWVRPTGLDTALLFGGLFWVGAIAAAVAWQRWLGMGPLERLYRRLGG